jgi:hypothetical protein
MTSLILEDKVTSSDVAPGFLAFVAFFSLAVILYFLMRNMNSRMRRMSYRQDAAGRTKNQPQATQDEAMEGLRGHAGIDPAPSRSSESAAGESPVGEGTAGEGTGGEGTVGEGKTSGSAAGESRLSESASGESTGGES